MREITVSRTRSNELESEMFVSHVTDKNFSIFCRVHELFRSHAMAKIFLDSLFSTGISIDPVAHAAAFMLHTEVLNLMSVLL